MTETLSEIRNKTIEEQLKEKAWFAFVKKCNELDDAISLLKQCVNYDNEPMTTAISGELGDRIREFIGRCENA